MNIPTLLRLWKPTVYNNLKDSGQTYTICPSEDHSDTNPSFSINVDEGLVQCHTKGCRFNGPNGIKTMDDFVLRLPLDAQSIYHSTSPSSSTPKPTQSSDSGEWITSEDFPLAYSGTYMSFDRDASMGVMEARTPKKKFYMYTVKATPDGFRYKLGVPKDSVFPPYVQGKWKDFDACKKILVVEGPKACAPLQKKIDSLGLPFFVISWLNGGGNVRKTDWSCLEGKDVYFAPDMDIVGLGAAMDFKDLVPHSKFLLEKRDSKKVKGQDLEDDLAREDFEAYFRTLLENSSTSPGTELPLDKYALRRSREDHFIFHMIAPHIGINENLEEYIEDFGDPYLEVAKKLHLCGMKFFSVNETPLVACRLVAGPGTETIRSASHVEVKKAVDDVMRKHMIVYPSSTKGTNHWPKMEEAIKVFCSKNRHALIQQSLEEMAMKADPNTDYYKQLFEAIELQENTRNIPLYEEAQYESLKHWLRASVLRARWDFTKPMNRMYYSGIMVMQGNREAGKTEFCRKLYGDKYCESVRGFFGKNGTDQRAMLTDTLILEDAEAETRSHAELQAVKDFATNFKVTSRQMYTDNKIVTPIRTNILTSTNDLALWSDSGETRRPKMMFVEKINLDKMDEIIYPLMCQISKECNEYVDDGMKVLRDHFIELSGDLKETQSKLIHLSAYSGKLEELFMGSHTLWNIIISNSTPKPKADGWRRTPVSVFQDKANALYPAKSNEFKQEKIQSFIKQWGVGKEHFLRYTNDARTYYIDWRPEPLLEACKEAGIQGLIYKGS